MIIPFSVPELDGARRRLEVWRVEHIQESLITRPRFHPPIPVPLDNTPPRYAMEDCNVHSLLLIAFVKPEMSIGVRFALVDLAALVSIGPSSIFDLSTTEGQRDHRETVQRLGETAGFARRHYHKGLLWQALACFHASKYSYGDGGVDRTKPPYKIIDEATRFDVVRELTIRGHFWKQWLHIYGPDENPYTLSDEEFDTVEKIVAAAFAFNFMRVPVEDTGYFGRDITSDVILEEEADGETVDWDALKKEAKDGGDLQVMAIYTHLQMDVVNDDLKVYRAVGTTAISNSAFCNGLMDLGIEHYRSLRPPVKPDHRCLVPRGSS